MLVEEMPELLARDALERAQESPLVWPWLHRLWVEEDARSGGTAAALQRQRDQVPEPFLRPEVLIREQPVVAREVELRPPGHRLPEQQRSQPPRRTRGDRCCEEDPDVGAVTRAAALKRSRHLALAAGFEEGERVELPRPAVEVAGEKPAAVVLEQRVDADRLAPVQMAHDRLVGQRQVGLRPGLRPAAGGRRHVAALARAGVLPAQRIDVVAAAEQASQQRDLLGRGSIDETRGRPTTMAVTCAGDRLRSV
jgi:hypothetical protein